MNKCEIKNEFQVWRVLTLSSIMTQWIMTQGNEHCQYVNSQIRLIQSRALPNCLLVAHSQKESSNKFLVVSIRRTSTIITYCLFCSLFRENFQFHCLFCEWLISQFSLMTMKKRANNKFRSEVQTSFKRNSQFPVLFMNFTLYLAYFFLFREIIRVFSIVVKLGFHGEHVYSHSRLLIHSKSRRQREKFKKWGKNRSEFLAAFAWWMTAKGNSAD